LKKGSDVLKRRRNESGQATRRNRGTVFVEYIILLTLVGIGSIVGLVAVRGALVDELRDLARAVRSLIS
jgi:hypothetical protein